VKGLTDSEVTYLIAVVATVSSGIAILVILYRAG
jgi:hypothetical protein